MHQLPNIDSYIETCTCTLKLPSRFTPERFTKISWHFIGQNCIYIHFMTLHTRPSCSLVVHLAKKLLQQLLYATANVTHPPKVDERIERRGQKQERRQNYMSQL